MNDVADISCLYLRRGIFIFYSGVRDMKFAPAYTPHGPSALLPSLFLFLRRLLTYLNLVCQIRLPRLTDVRESSQMRFQSNVSSLYVQCIVQINVRYEIFPFHTCAYLRAFLCASNRVRALVSTLFVSCRCSCMKNASDRCDAACVSFDDLDA